VFVAILILDLLRAVGDEVSRLAVIVACPRVLLMFTRFSCSLSNLLVNYASSSSPSTSNSSSDIDIKEDKENILVDELALAFPFEPMRVSQALDLGCQAPIHLSRLELREQLVPVRVSYFFDSTMASNFPPQTIRSNECKSLTALS
jgi:hypothetical protein